MAQKQAREVIVLMLRVMQAKALPQLVDTLQAPKDSLRDPAGTRGHGSSKKNVEILGVATKCKAVPYLSTLDPNTSLACSSAHSTKFSEEKVISNSHKNYGKSTYSASQSSLCREGDLGVINSAAPVPIMESVSQEVTNGASESAPPGNYTSQGLGEKKPAKWKKYYCGYTVGF